MDGRLLSSVADVTLFLSQKHVVETFFGFDEESVDSETLSETSYNTDRTDRTPATPEEDVDEVSKQQYPGNFPLSCCPGLLPLSALRGPNGHLPQSQPPLRLKTAKDTPRC